MPEREVLRPDEDVLDELEESTDYFEFETRVCPDGYPYMTFEDDDGREPGFFFSLNGLKEYKANSKLRFHFPHLSYQRK